MLTKITEFQFPPPKAFARSLAVGADGNVWFSVSAEGMAPAPIATQVGVMTPDGTVREFPLPAPEETGVSIAWGPDNTIWYLRSGSTDAQGKIVDPWAIGHITSNGALKEFPIYGYGGSLAAGPDGALWFTEEKASSQGLATGAIGRISVAGKITEYPITFGGALPQCIIIGRDNALWFSISPSQPSPGGASSIVRMTTDGAMKVFPLPASADPPESLAFGPDGALWFVEAAIDLEQGQHLGRLQLSGDYQRFPLKPGGYFAGSELAVGPDNAVWVAGPGVLERFTVAGVETTIALPNPKDVAVAIVAGPKNTLWFSEVPADSHAAGKIARLS
jgi:virginiamycin B lyase